MVAGLAAWALSVDPTLSAAELHALLVDSAVPSPLVTADENGHHPYYGYGEVDPAALLAALVPADSGQPTSVDPAAEDPKGGCGCSGLGARPHGALFALLLGLGLRARRRP